MPTRDGVSGHAPGRGGLEERRRIDLGLEEVAPSLRLPRRHRDVRTTMVYTHVRPGSNVVLLEPDVAAAFSSGNAVNETGPCRP